MQDTLLVMQSCNSSQVFNSSQNLGRVEWMPEVVPSAGNKKCMDGTLDFGKMDCMITWASGRP